MLRIALATFRRDSTPVKRMEMDLTTMTFLQKSLRRTMEMQMKSPGQQRLQLQVGITMMVARMKMSS